MIKVLTALACTCAAMAFTGTAGATVRFGVNESAGKGADRGIGFFGTLNNIGLTENAVTLSWNAAAPQQIVGKPDLDLWMPQAAIRGIRVVLVVSPARPKDLTSAPDNAAKFASFLQLVARTYPQVKDFVVGNEPNQPKFWQPQFDENGQNVSGAAYEQVLAQSYDALKAFDPKINVIGLGLSARGNDMPNAPSNISTSPIRFLYYLGKAYRASGRTKPLMDELAFHPYPNVNTDAPLKGYQWPNAGIPNLDRVKQVIWDAFNGTGQPVFAESGLRQAHPLKLDLDETGWQVGIPPNLAVLYHGKENVPVIDESTQAQYYGDIVRYIVCDPDVVSLSFYHLIDESDLDRWQSGLLRLDGSRRPPATRPR